MPVIRGPVIGKPADAKEGGSRVDFKEAQFFFLIEHKGVRLAWSRASICFCGPNNTQTRQPNPNCTRCKGRGFIYFKPADYAVPADAGVLDPLQSYILEHENAVVIRGFTQSVTQNNMVYSQIGEFVFGGLLITVRPENRLGYYDRLVLLDLEMSYSELLIVPDSSVPIEGRYPMLLVNYFESATKRYEEGADFQLNTQGRIEFLPGQAPTGAQRYAVHYHHRPVLLVTDFMHLFRYQTKKFKTPPQDLITPLGDPKLLPIQAMAKVEFLIK